MCFLNLVHVDKEIDDSSVKCKMSNINSKKETQKNKQKVNKKMDDSKKIGAKSHKEFDQEQLKKKVTLASEQSPTTDDGQSFKVSELSTNDNAVASAASATVGQYTEYTKSVHDHSNLQISLPNNSTLTPVKDKKSLITNGMKAYTYSNYVRSN